MAAAGPWRGRARRHDPGPTSTFGPLAREGHRRRSRPRTSPLDQAALWRARRGPASHRACPGLASVPIRRWHPGDARRSCPSFGAPLSRMFIGLDLGTSALKALLVDEDERVVGTASVPLTVLRPRPGWSEQDPQDWGEAALAALDELASRDPAEIAAVRGTGLSGQMHGAVLLDGV